MAHIRTITVRNGDIPEKAMDAAGQAFFQIWLAVFTWILTGAFSSK